MTVIIETNMLRERYACPRQVDNFVQLFGERAEFTSLADLREACVKYATFFDWDWAAVHLLRTQAWDEYDRVMAQARAEYEFIRAQDRAEYEHLRRRALDEYGHLRERPWAKYMRIRAPAKAEHRRTKATAWADAYWEQETT